MKDEQRFDRLDFEIGHDVASTLAEVSIAFVSFSASRHVSIKFLITDLRKTEIIRLLGLEGGHNLLHLNGWQWGHSSFVPHWTVCLSLATLIFIYHCRYIKTTFDVSGACSDEFLERVKSATHQIPESIAKFVPLRKYRIFASRHIAPGSFLQVSKGESVLGFWQPWLNFIVISETIEADGVLVALQGEELHTLAHEIGHAVDHKVQGSSSLLFGDAYKLDSRQTSTDDRDVIPHCITKKWSEKSESFAELFASLCGMSPNPRLEARFPKCAEYVNRKLDLIRRRGE